MNTNTNYTYETEIPDALLADLPEEARDQENVNRVSFTYWQTCWKRMKKDKLAMFGIVVIIAMAILAVFGPMLCPYSYDDADFMAILQGPSLKHWFGTDGLGPRCICPYSLRRTDQSDHRICSRNRQYGDRSALLAASRISGWLGWI